MWRGIQRSNQVCIKLTKSFLINRKNKTRADMETILPLRNDASPLEKWHSLGEKEGVEGRDGKGVTLRRKRTWLHHMVSIVPKVLRLWNLLCAAATQVRHTTCELRAGVLCDECVAGRMLLQRNRVLIKAIELITIPLTVNDRSNKLKRSYLSLSQSLSKSV